MKVLFFNYEYPPLGGGAGNATSYILKEFSQVPDLQVDLITSSAENIFEQERIGANINIHKLPIGNKRKNLHYQSQKDLLLYAWKAFWYSRKLLKENRYDLTHSFFTVPCGFLSLLIKWQKNIPYMVSLRGADVPGYSDRFPIIYFFLKPIIKMIWSYAGSVVSNSQGLKDLALKTNSKQKIGIIFNGIDVQEFKPAENLPVAKNFTVLCVSRLTERKGINYLIESVKKLETENIRLLIAGEGDCQTELKKLTRDLDLQNRIKFLGRLDHSDLPKIYQQAQVFVLPSLNEGMSNTMLEALASGLPLIATDTGGTRELIEENRNGFIVKMEDAQDIAEKIKNLLHDKEKREEMARASREKALTLSWEKVADQYLEEYKKLQKENE